MTDIIKIVTRTYCICNRNAENAPLAYDVRYRPENIVSIYRAFRLIDGK